MPPAAHLAELQERFAQLHQRFVKTFEQFKSAGTRAEKGEFLEALHRILAESKALLQMRRVLKGENGIGLYDRTLPYR